MTARELNEIIDEYVGNDFGNPRPIDTGAVFRRAVPIVLKLELAKAKAYDWARRIGNVLEAMKATTGIFALEDEDALDEPLTEIRDGVFSSTVTIDDVDYRFTKSTGDPRRTDGSNLTQTFLKALPEGWVKPTGEVKANKSFLRSLTPSQLRARGLYLPDKYTWAEDV